MWITIYFLFCLHNQYLSLPLYCQVNQLTPQPMSTTTQSFADVLIAKAQAKGYQATQQNGLWGFNHKKGFVYHWFHIDDHCAIYDHTYSQNTGMKRFKITKQMELEKRLGW